LRRDPEAGSALILMPAAVLVVVVLGAIAVDAAVMFLGERELAATVAAAANDAAVAGISRDTFYECGSLRADPVASRRIAATSIAARSSDAVKVTDVSVDVTASDPPTVTVSAVGQVELIFSPAVPGGRSIATVDAVSVATAVASDAGPQTAC